jgi:hypothetical protein
MIEEIREHIRARCNAQAPTFLELGDAKELLDYLDEAKPEPVVEPIAEIKPAEPEPAKEPEQIVDLEDMTKDELLEHADSVGAEVSKSDNKADIVKAIKKAEKAKNK